MSHQLPHSTRDTLDRSSPQQPGEQEETDLSSAPAAPETLIELICIHRGTVNYSDLSQAGFPPRTIQAWLDTGVLIQDLSGVYQLAEPEVYIDELILALWRLPAGTPATIGGLTALEYHGYSVANMTWVDVALPADTPHQGESLLQGAALELFEPLKLLGTLDTKGVSPSSLPSLPSSPLPLQMYCLPDDLWAYGQEEVTPGLPGTVAIPMYQPAVALVQVLADPTMDLDTLMDAVLRYTGYRGEDEALDAALRRYNRYDVVSRFHTIKELGAHAFV